MSDYNRDKIVEYCNVKFEGDTSRKVRELAADLGMTLSQAAAEMVINWEDAQSGKRKAEKRIVEQKNLINDLSNENQELRQKFDNEKAECIRILDEKLECEMEVARLKDVIAELAKEKYQK